jgi:hypothetical protein
MKRHALDVEARATLPKLGCAVAGAHGGKIGEKRADFGQGGEDLLNLFAEPDLGRQLASPAGFHPKEADYPLVPIHVFGLQVCQV